MHWKSAVLSFLSQQWQEKISFNMWRKIKPFQDKNKYQKWHKRFSKIMLFFKILFLLNPRISVFMLKSNIFSMLLHLAKHHRTIYYQKKFLSNRRPVTKTEPEALFFFSKLVSLNRKFYSNTKKRGKPDRINRNFSFFVSHTSSLFDRF